MAVAVWLAMLGLLAARRAPQAGIDPTALPAAEMPGDVRDEWFGLYQASRKIGHSSRVTRAIPGGRRFEDVSHLEIALLGVPQAIDTRLVAETDTDLRLRRFAFTLASAAATFAASGEADGSSLTVRLDADGSSRTLVLPLERPIHLTGALRPRIAASRPVPGARFVHDVLNPLTLRHEPLATVVEAIEERDGRETLRLVEEHQGLQARVWLDPDGRVVREESALGFTMVAEPYEVAVAGVDRGAPVDLALATRIPLVGRLGDDPRALAALRLRVTGAAAAAVPDDPPRQRVRDGVLHIEREALPSAGATREPPGAAVTHDAPAARFLAPEPFIESDDPLVAARARAAVGDARDDETRARRLVRWVHETMRPEPAATVPSAREVIRTLRGDCNEHAVLLAAMARAAGIPARVVAGAMYADGAFLYHAWTELWLGGWVTADATLEQMPVDATHVKLVEGGPAAHVALAGLLGRLGFETVDEGT